MKVNDNQINAIVDRVVDQISGEISKKADSINTENKKISPPEKNRITRKINSRGWVKGQRPIGGPEGQRPPKQKEIWDFKQLNLHSNKVFSTLHLQSIWIKN